MIHVLNILLFTACCIVSGLIIKALFITHTLQNRIVTVTSDSSKSRRIREEQLRQLEGEQEKTNVLYAIDLILEQSGIKKYIPSVNAELYILSVGVTAVIVFAVCCAAGGWLIGLAGMLAAITVAYVVPQILAENNYKNTEKDILQFVNLVGSYSATSNNIITIFGNMYLYLNDPLKSAVKMCYDEAQMTGDISSALLHLEARINHPLFKMTIRNIEISSRHEANYSEIIAAIREIIREYIRNQEEVKAMISSARGQLIILLGAGAVIMYMVNGLLDGVDLFNTLTTTLPGQLILGALAVVIAICVYIFMSFGNKGR